jgi:deoxyadenosine/deoxycytidine kinase
MANTAPMLVVAGNIATGKTQLLEAVSDELGLRPFPERWDQNPWFDGDQRNAFAAQMWFLLAAGADHARMAAEGGIQERCIHEHARVFARELLAGEDARLLEEVYSRLDAELRDPALLIYLKASLPELCERIRGRGRIQERGLTSERLEGLQSRYDELIREWSRCPVVEVDTESVDVRSAAGVRHVLERAAEELA